MRFRRSLRFRIIFSYLGFGAAIGGVLALFLAISLYELEDRLVSEHVSDELQYFVKLANNNPKIHTLRTKKLLGYVFRPGEPMNGLEFLEQMNSGVHDIDYGNRKYVVAMQRENGTRYYMLYDQTDVKVREHFLSAVLLASIVLATLFAIWFGWSLSDRLIAPVIQLARRVESLPPSDATEEMLGEYANDEVGSLAEAFRSYIQRLESFIQRERTFTADASHELRTPLAVIQGAVEVLLARRDLSPQDRTRLERIERASNDMSQSLDALLVLAREPGAGASVEGETEVAEAVHDAIQNNRTHLAEDEVEVNVQVLANPMVAAPDTIVGILIGNLVRNAFRYTPRGSVTITLGPDSLTIQDTGIGIRSEDLERVFERGFRAADAPGSGSGVGLSLCKRICDHFRWGLDITSQPGVGTRVVWTFPSTIPETPTQDEVATAEG
jgi:signal transduction histidine kinase